MESTSFDINGFRNAAPYINAHRGKVFVVEFGGEAVADPSFSRLVHDLALLYSLGIKLVLVHGARPQIEQRLEHWGVSTRYHQGRRITDSVALGAVKEAVGCVRVEIEALLSMGLVNTPMSGMGLRVTSGNFVTAKPLGIREGIDFQHTGEVRKIDTDAIRHLLAEDNIVLLSALGYSPTGETFNVSALEIAIATASALQAHKLILLMEESPIGAHGTQYRQLGLAEAQALLEQKPPVSPELARHLRHAVIACRHDVRRVHLLDRRQDGAILKELFTRDGTGTLITGEIYEDLRDAHIDDVGGLLELIAPLERSGILVHRSREQLELEIDRFTVIERDSMILGCAALYPVSGEKMGELACFAVHPDYQNSGRGDALLRRLETKARTLGLEKIFVLTTRTAHWFLERGFVEGEAGSLPIQRQELYNYRRNSKVFVKELGNTL